MPEDRTPPRVAVNVMRARLTVVGFNLAVIALQLGRLDGLPGGVDLPTFNQSVHLDPAVTLLVAMALSMLAVIAFIVSCDFDLAGTCDHWILVAGDLFMYAGLAHTIAGFFAPMIQVIDLIVLDSGQEADVLITARTALAVLGGGGWLAAMYLGPAVSLVRSPFGRPATLSLAGAYVVLVLLLAFVNAQVVLLELAIDPELDKPPPTVLNELIQPLRW